MQNVLIVAAHIPPYHQGQVMRVAKLVKYLPGFGWNAVIVAAKADLGMEHITDLTSDIGRAKKIYRAHYVNLVKFYHSAREKFLRPKGIQADSGSTASAANRASLAARYLVPDHYFTWIPFAILKGITAISTQKVEAIISMSPLPSNLVVGYVLHLLFRKPWVIDLRDPWTTNPISTPRAHPLLGRFDLLLERAFLKKATKVVVINRQFIPPLKKQHPMLADDKFVIVPNGYDPDDFKGIDRLRFDRFTIVHCGNFYQDRSPEYFFRALKVVLTEQPETAQHIQVKFMGATDQRTQLLLRESGLDHFVELVGFVPHKVSLQYIMSADCLLLIPGPGESTMTGKIFEYLASGNPILALAGTGAASEIVAATNSGAIVPPYDVPAIAEEILRLYHRYCNKGTVAPQGEGNCGTRNQYSRVEIARSFGLLLNDLTAVK